MTNILSHLLLLLILNYELPHIHLIYQKFNYFSTVIQVNVKSSLMTAYHMVFMVAYRVST